MVDLKEAENIVAKAEMELTRRMIEGNREAANVQRVKVEEAKAMVEKIKNQPVKKAPKPRKTYRRNKKVSEE
tara:strand:+ start:174 stop:389 length:216 start_codon:yes stop_codon:yes gene_type:complete